MYRKSIIMIIAICFSMDAALNEMDVENLLINHLTNTAYRPSIRPSIKSNNSSQKNHQPTEVKVRMVINEIGSICVANNEFTVGITLNQMWSDQRLIFNQSFEFLSLTYLKSRIWTPDLHFYNTKSILGNLQMASLLWLYPNGSIVYSNTLRLILYCNIALSRYPLDTQRCRIELCSYGYPTEDLRLRWWHDVDENARNVRIRNVFSTEYHYPTFTIGENHSSVLLNGLFSMLTVDFVFKRNYTYHIIYTFLPSTLIVCVSWISFHIDYRAVPARVPICLITLLALMAQWSSVNAALPRLSYVKYVDVWMFICMTFVIFSLLEYAVINQLVMKRERDEKRLVKRRECKKFMSRSHSFELSLTSKGLLSTEDSHVPLRKDCEAKQKKRKKPPFQPYVIDKISSFTFPLSFIMVSIIFWSMLIFYDES